MLTIARRKRRSCLRGAILLFLLCIGGWAQGGDTADDLIEWQLLQERQQHHEVLAESLRLAAMLPPPSSPEQWRDEASALRRRILEDIVLKGVPEQWLSRKPGVEAGATIAGDCGYSIQKIRYEAVPGLWIPALLYQPSEPGEAHAAVLQLSGHVGPDGKAISFEQELAHELAQRGYVVLSPDWPAHGEMSQLPYSHNRLSQLNAVGVSGLAVFYLTAQRGFELLSKVEGVDPAKIAVTGLSGGGWQTIVLSALDTRVALAAPVAGFIGFGERVKIGNIGDLEQNAVDLHAVADYTHLAALVAPRPMLLVYNAEDDCCFPVEGADRSVTERVRPYYGMFDALQNLGRHVNHAPGTHNYEEDNQNAFLWFLEQHLPASRTPFRGDSCQPADGVRPVGDLAVGLPEGNETFRSLALPVLTERRRGAGAAPRKDLEHTVRWNEMEATGRVVLDKNVGDLRVRIHMLKAGGYSLPSVLVEPARPTGDCRTVLVADAGRSASIRRAKELASEGCSVLLVDLLLQGSERARQYYPGWYAQLLSTVGLRSVGIQAAQIVAAASFHWGDGSRFRVESQGRRSGLASLIAAALRPSRFESVSLAGFPSELSEILDEDVYYNDEPEWFCFGLMNRFDVAALRRLASPVEVRLAAGGAKDAR